MEDCDPHSWFEVLSWRESLRGRPVHRRALQSIHLLPGTHSFQESDARWANATIKVDEDNLVPVPLGFDTWMHFGDGEFVLTGPVDSTAVTGIIVRRLHDGGCGIMQFDQLQSSSSCSTLTRAWRSLSSCLRLPHMRAAEQNGRAASTRRSCTSWFLARRGGTEPR